MIGVKAKKRQVGFTLIEMLMAVTIFSLAMTSAVTIFLVANAAQKKTGVMQKIDSEAKSFTEYFVNTMKSAELDYGVAYVNPYSLTQTNVLKFINANKQFVVWRLLTIASGHVWQQCQRADRYCSVVDLTEAWYDLHDRSIDISNLSFFITPTVSPYTVDADGHYASDQQPQATMVVTVNKTQSDLTPMVWQATVASRLYKR